MKRLLLLSLVAVQFAASQSLSGRMDRIRTEHDLFSQPIALAGQPIWQSDVYSSPEKKSVPLAALYSLLLPGMGELYAGNYGMGKYFTMAEGALWLGLYGTDQYAHWLRDDSRSFAALHAGITPDGKSDQYFIDIGNFVNVQQYNEQVLRDRDVAKVYDANSSYAWSWDDPANRAVYRGQRISSENMFNNTKFIAAAIIVNHVVSAINAARLTISHNKNLSDAGFIDVHARLIGGLTNTDGVMLCFSKNF